MDLREYLFRKRMSVSDFAKKINYSRQHVSSVMHGNYQAGEKLAEAIETATDGEVKAKDILNNKMS